jgi:DNA-binding transcriptional ArsR family regulator
MGRVERTGDDAVFHALADGTRRAILDSLRDGPQTTGGLADQHPSMTRFGVMDHLQVLVDAGLVVVERRGRKRLNHLNPVPIQRIHDRWTGRFARGVATELLALDEAAARKGRSSKGDHRNGH